MKAHALLAFLLHGAIVAGWTADAAHPASPLKASEVLISFAHQLRSIGPIDATYVYYALRDEGDIAGNTTNFITDGTPHFVLKVTSPKNAAEGENTEVYAVDADGFMLLDGSLRRVFFAPMPKQPDGWSDPIDKQIKRAFPMIRLIGPVTQLGPKHSDTLLNPVLFGADWLAFVDRYCRVDGYIRYARWCDLFDDRLIAFIGDDLLTLEQKGERDVELTLSNPIGKKFLLNGEQPFYKFWLSLVSVGGETFWRTSKEERTVMWDYATRPSSEDNGVHETIEFTYDEAIGRGAVPSRIETSVNVDGEVEKISSIRLQKIEAADQLRFATGLSEVKDGKYQIFDVHAKMLLGE